MKTSATAAEYQFGHDLQELSDDQLQLVSGGVIPLAVAVYYAAGFASGVAAGWTVGSSLFRLGSKCN